LLEWRRMRLSEQAAGASKPLWLKNGPAFPFDLCFDFANSRILLLRAGSLATGSAGLLGRILGKGWEREQYGFGEDLTLEERAKADKDGVIIPFDSVARLILGKSWGRPPFLRIEVNLTVDEMPSPERARFVRRHEFALSSERHLQGDQIRQIRQVVPSSRLGPRFEDKVR
jgi:hypothetical protein